MPFALARWTTKCGLDKPTNIEPPRQYEDLIVLARPKLSYAVSQPNIWIRWCNQFEISWEVERRETLEDQDARLMREIVTAIKAELDRGGE